MIAFPELRRESTLELPVIGALSAVLAGLLLSVSWLLGALAFVPCAGWLLHSAWLGVLNSRLRYRWSLQFPTRVSCSRLRALLTAEPARYVVHVRSFGGFDVTPLCPAADVEDLHTGAFAAVHPASGRVPRLCERLGVRMVGA
jgi:hypothetical protein